MRVRVILSVVGHILFWGLIHYTLQQVINDQTIENVKIINGVTVRETIQINQSLNLYIILFTSIILFYTNTRILLPNFLKTGKFINYTVFLIGLFTVCFSCTLLLNKILILTNDKSSENEFFLYASIPIYGALLGISFAYFFIGEWIKNEQVKRKLHEENLKTELNFLRAQIQPHFLFNVLNNLFYMARETGHKELIAGISSLSTMLRYMVYEGNSDTVPLVREVTYLDHYIQLQTMKFAEQDKIKFEFIKEGEFSSIMVAPFLFLPIVENAFKYGINFESESIIQIELKVDSHQLLFFVSNTDFSSIHTSNKEKSGIGLENIRKRLDLIYPGNYVFTAGSKGGFFESYLCINLE